MRAAVVGVSHPLHKTIDHALLARLVEADRQLGQPSTAVTLPLLNLVEDAVANGIGREGAGRFGDQVASGEAGVGQFGWRGAPISSALR